MNNICVSVVIPFYDHVVWLEEAVESVCQQTYENYEIIVVNDGSQEDMTGFLKKYGSRIVYIYKENGGPATARNVGIERAKGKYVAFLDSDDVWLPDKLKIQVERMEQSDCVWSYCGYRTFGMGENKMCIITKADSDEIHRYYKPNIATPSVMVRKDMLIKHQDYRFNNKIRFGEDSYMWLKINADNSILAIHECLLHVRIRGNNAAKRARIQLRARGYIWQCRKNEKRELIDKFNVSLLYRGASNLCICGDKIVCLFEKMKFSDNLIELISKVLFVIPWGIFKLDRRILF